MPGLAESFLRAIVREEMVRQPDGAVMFLFTDIEGSTQLIEEVGEARYEELLRKHSVSLRGAFLRHGGVEVDTQGDAFFYVFDDANAALRAAGEAQAALTEGRVAVRMGTHTGEALRGETGYVGREVHRAARIAAAGHGGQVVVSAVTAAAVDAELTELGEHRLKDFASRSPSTSSERLSSLLSRRSRTRTCRGRRRASWAATTRSSMSPTSFGTDPAWSH
jgi:class 3 adenylate cyclase